MAGTSVTGRGQGSADGGIKGPGKGRNASVPILTPHILAAGQLELTAGFGGFVGLIYPDTVIPEIGHMSAAESNVNNFGVFVDADVDLGCYKFDIGGRFAIAIVTALSETTVDWMITSMGVKTDSVADLALTPGV